MTYLTYAAGVVSFMWICRARMVSRAPAGAQRTQRPEDFGLHPLHIVIEVQIVESRDDVIIMLKVRSKHQCVYCKVHRS